MNNTLSYRGFLMSLAGWVATVILIVLAFIQYYTIYYSDLLLGFEGNQFYEITGSRATAFNNCMKFELEIPKFIAPFDENSLTFRVKNEEKYTDTEGNEHTCPTIEGDFLFHGRLIRQTVILGENTIIETNEAEVQKLWPVSFTIPLTDFDTEEANLSSSVVPRVGKKLDPGKITDVPIKMRVTSLPNDDETTKKMNLLQKKDPKSTTHVMLLVKYDVEFVPKGSQSNKNGQSSSENLQEVIPIVFKNPANSCVTGRIKDVLTKENVANVDPKNDHQVNTWFANSNLEGDVEGYKNANEWPCSEINFLLAFRQTAIQRLLLSPFSNTLIPLFVLAVVFLLDDALPVRSKENFFPRVITLLSCGLTLLLFIFDQLNTTFISKTNLAFADIWWMLARIFFMIAIYRIIYVPIIWALLRLIMFSWIQSLFHYRRLTEQELYEYWQDFKVIPFRCWMRRPIVQLLLAYASDIQTNYNPLLIERQRRAYEKILQIDPKCPEALKIAGAVEVQTSVIEQLWWHVYDNCVKNKARRSETKLAQSSETETGVGI